jgi:hypothetical protein
MDCKNVTNLDICELLARAAEHAKQSLQRALRRAARRSLLWPEEAEDILNGGRSLTELPAIGPYLNKQILNWLEHPPGLDWAIPEIRPNFLTVAEAKAMRSREQARFAGIRRDLQMHTAGSDGSGSIQDMAEAAAALEYSYLAITRHSKGSKIAGGINGEQLEQQAEEIPEVNELVKNVRVLCSLELNLSPTRAVDMNGRAFQGLDLVPGCFHSALRRKEDQIERYLNALHNPWARVNSCHTANADLSA